MTLKELSEVFVDTRFIVTVFQNNRSIGKLDIDYSDTGKDVELLKYIELKDYGAVVKWVKYNKAEECNEISVIVQ